MSKVNNPESALFLIDNLGQVVASDLGWGLILYGEEEEKVMAASSDPVISKIWKASQFFTGDYSSVILRGSNRMLLLRADVRLLDLFTINFPVQMKEEVELDDTYAVLKEHIFITKFT